MCTRMLLLNALESVHDTHRLHAPVMRVEGEIYSKLRSSATCYRPAHLFHHIAGQYWLAQQQVAPVR